MSLADDLKKLEDLRRSGALSQEEFARAKERILAGTTARIPTEPKGVRPGEIICRNVNGGFIGKPKKVARGSLVVGIIFTLLFILPGLLYFVFMAGYNYICPRCGLHIRGGTHI